MLTGLTALFDSRSTTKKFQCLLVYKLALEERNTTYET